MNLPTSPDEPLTAALGLLLADIRVVQPGEPPERTIPAQHRVSDIRQARRAFAVAEDTAAALRIPPVSGDEVGRMALALRWLGLSDEQVAGIRTDSGNFLTAIPPVSGDEGLRAAALTLFDPMDHGSPSKPNAGHTVEAHCRECVKVRARRAVAIRRALVKLGDLPSIALRIPPVSGDENVREAAQWLVNIWADNVNLRRGTALWEDIERLRTALADRSTKP